MKYIQMARAVGGLLSVISLLVMLTAHVVAPGITVGPWVVGILLSLIGGLLAVDVFKKDLPTLKIGLEKDDD